MGLDKLSSRHIAMMRMLVLDGVKANDVCEEFGVKASSLSIMRTSPIWIEKENDMRREAFDVHRKELDKLIEPAIKGLGETIISNDESIKLRSAKEILDRTGFIPGVRVEVDNKPIIRMYIPKNWNTDGEIVEGEVVNE